MNNQKFIEKPLKAGEVAVEKKAAEEEATWDAWDAAAASWAVWEADETE